MNTLNSKFLSNCPACSSFRHSKFTSWTCMHGILWEEPRWNRRHVHWTFWCWCCGMDSFQQSFRDVQHCPKRCETWAFPLMISGFSNSKLVNKWLSQLVKSELPRDDIFNNIPCCRNMKPDFFFSTLTFGNWGCRGCSATLVRHTHTQTQRTFEWIPPYFAAVDFAPTTAMAIDFDYSCWAAFEPAFNEHIQN